MNDPLNEASISPYKVNSYIKAMQLLEMDSNLANTASNTNAAVSMLNDIKTQNTQIISLLQQLVDKQYNSIVLVERTFLISILNN